MILFYLIEDVLLVTNTLSASNSGFASLRPRISTHDANPSFNLEKYYK